MVYLMNKLTWDNGTKTHTTNLFMTPKNILAPIIFTMDKTVILEASHLSSVHVILFSMIIFNREISMSYTNIVYFSRFTMPLHDVTLLDLQYIPMSVLCMTFSHFMMHSCLLTWSHYRSAKMLHLSGHCPFVFDKNDSILTKTNQF
jgi:hypothetical protein